MSAIRKKIIAIPTSQGIIFSWWNSRNLNDLINRTPNRPMIHHAETVRQISYMFLASLVSLVWLDCILSLRFHTFGIGQWERGFQDSAFPHRPAVLPQETQVFLARPSAVEREARQLHEKASSPHLRSPVVFYLKQQPWILISDRSFCAYSR